MKKKKRAELFKLADSIRRYELKRIYSGNLNRPPVTRGAIRVNKILTNYLTQNPLSIYQAYDLVFKLGDRHQVNTLKVPPVGFLEELELRLNSEDFPNNSTFFQF